MDDRVTAFGSHEVEHGQAASEELMSQIRRKTWVAFAVSLLCASNAVAQHASALRGTASLGLIGQQTSMLGSFWPGAVGSAGFSVRLAPILSVRAEGEAAGFATGGAAEADCIANAPCPSWKTPWGIAGGSALLVVRHEGVPIFAGIGIGAWRASDDTRIRNGATYVGGVTLSSRRQIAIEGRFNRPSTAMGIVTSTLSLGLRLAP